MAVNQRLQSLYNFAALHKSAFLIVAALLVLYLSCFILAPQMGLYSDDFRIARQWDQGFRYDWNIIKNALLTWPQGRPLIGLQVAMMGTLGWELGGVRGVYVLSYLVLAGNALLVLAILRRIAPLSIAFIGALMIVLYPGDAAKVTYIRATQVQFVVLLFLLATWSYLKGHRVWPYLLMVWAAGLYETVILPFFFVPLLRIPWRQGFLRDQIRHGAVLFVVMGGVLALRLFFVMDANLAKISTNFGPATLLMRSVTAVVLGAFTSAKLLIVRGYSALEYISWESGFVMGVVGLSVAAGLALALGQQSSVLATGQGLENRPSRRPAWPPFEWAPWAQLLSVGAVMWLAAYPFFVAFNRFPPTAELGRMTTPHAAAEVGVAFVVSALAWRVLRSMAGVYQRRLFIGACAIYFSLLAGFQVHVQKELVQVWWQQKKFWRAVVQAAPDMQPGTLIVIDPFKGGWAESGAERRLQQSLETIKADPSIMVWHYGEYTRHIPWSPRHVIPETPDKTWYTSSYAESLPWNIQFILPQIVKVKDRENRAARTLWVWQMEKYPFMRVTIRPENNGEIKLYLKKNWYKNMQGNIIWLEADNQYTFKRITGTKVIQGVSFRLKEPGPSTLGQREKGPLYDAIFDE